MRTAEFLIRSYALFPVGELPAAASLTQWGVAQVGRMFALAFGLGGREVAGREAGRTWFKMGIAIHHGRVYLARFVAGGTVQATVLGRNVNLAGRLSSA